MESVTTDSQVCRFAKARVRNHLYGCEGSLCLRRTIHFFSHAHRSPIYGASEMYREALVHAPLPHQYISWELQTTRIARGLDKRSIFRTRGQKRIIYAARSGAGTAHRSRQLPLVISLTEIKARVCCVVSDRQFLYFGSLMVYCIFVLLVKHRCLYHRPCGDWDTAAA